MSDPVVYDLDVLRPKPRIVRLAGKEIDVSFIPSGIAIDIMEMQQGLLALTDTPGKMAKVKDGGKEARKSFELAATLCAAITSAQHPEMDMEWLLKNTDTLQIKALMEHVTAAVFKSLNSVEDGELKNPEATEENPSP